MISRVDSRDHAGRYGLSLAGRDEPLDELPSLKRLGFSFLRLSLHVPPRTEEAIAIDAARASGCAVMAVIKADPMDPAVWESPLRQTILQFKDRVRHWEIGSEPDDAVSGWPQDDFVTYAARLKTAETLIKDVDPTALVHNGGQGRSLPKGIARLCALGVGTLIDIWNVHPYMNPLMPDAKGCLRYFHDMIHAMLVAQGQADKPVWWSSIACPGMTDPKATRDWWLGKNPTEALQADWLNLIMTQVPTWGVEKVFWEGWHDREPGSTKTGIDHFGLLRTDGSAKTAFNRLVQPV
jgi:hypothetical protein